MNISTNISIFNRIRFVDKLFFTKHLAVMIRSGITIGEAITIVREQSTNPAFKTLLTSVVTDINNGQSFEAALAKHPNVFDQFYLNLIHIGEESGNLEKNLEYLAVQLRKSYDFKKKIQETLLYPEIILITAIIAGGAISLFVLPKLVDLFSSLDVVLPLSTKILLFVANMMKHYGYFIFGGIIVLFILFRLFIRIPKIMFFWHKILLSLPIVGTFLKNIEIASMCRNISIMLKSGLPITTVLQAQYKATTNLVFRNYLKQVAEDVEKGQPISRKLSSKSFTYIPPLVAKMVSVGEKTGKLDESFAYLVDFYSDEVNEYSKTLPTVIEPIVLIFLGGVVAFVSLAIISPIYQLTSGIHR